MGMGIQYDDDEGRVDMTNNVFVDNLSQDADALSAAQQRAMTAVATMWYLSDENSSLLEHSYGLVILLCVFTLMTHITWAALVLVVAWLAVTMYSFHRRITLNNEACKRGGRHG